jgi:predicted SAM-dependent methyltransferase
MKLNLGCGRQVVDGWTNVDYSLGARLTKIPGFKALNRIFRFVNIDWDEQIYLHNLTKPFPWRDKSVDVIYSSHTLEHFTKGQGLLFLKECYRCLREGGIIRILVPDLKWYVSEYMGGNILATDFLWEIDVVNEEVGMFKKMFVAFPHQCMYDSKALMDIMNDIGFKQVGSRVAFESQIPDIALIELDGRTGHAVVVEAIK